MSEEVLIGRSHAILRVPRETWAQHLSQAPEHARARLRFMSEDHHRVRNMAVTELVRRGRPIDPEVFSQALQLSIPEVETILEELEQKLFFLVRDEHGAVSWAYPVTVEPTPHRLRFSTGEQLYAA